MRVGLLLVWLGAFALLAMPCAASADGLGLPRMAKAQRLVGPLGLDVVDQRVDAAGEARPPEQLGYRREGLGGWVPWTLDEPVSRWLREVVLRGASAGGVRLVPIRGGPVRLVIREFFCDGAPGLDPKCFVDVALQWDQGDGPEVLYRMRQIVPWGRGSNLDTRVPERLGQDIAHGVAEAFADSAETAPEPEEVAPNEPAQRPVPASRDRGPAPLDGRGFHLVDRSGLAWAPTTPAELDAPPRLYLVHAEEPSLRLSIDEAVQRLEDRQLLRWQQTLLADTRRQHRAAVTVSLVGAGLIGAGVLLGAIAVREGAAAPAALAWVSGVSGGITLGVAIPRAAGRAKHLNRLREGLRMDHLEDMRFLRHVLERRRMRDQARDAAPQGAGEGQDSE